MRVGSSLALFATLLCATVALAQEPEQTPTEGRRTPPEAPAEPSPSPAPPGDREAPSRDERAPAEAEPAEGAPAPEQAQSPEGAPTREGEPEPPEVDAAPTEDASAPVDGEASPSAQPSWAEAPAHAEPESHEPAWTDASHPRERPDYSGRGEPPRDPADDVLWIPRILFSPLYLLTEFVLRQPIGWLVTEVERTHLFDVFFDFFTWGEDRNAGLVPTVFFDFGFLPSVGLYLWWNNVGMEGHDIRVVAGFWGPQWLHARVLDRIRFDDHNELSFWVEGLRRPDYIWHGGGWGVRQNERSRFGRSNLGGGIQFESRRIWRGSGLRYFAMVDYNEFDNSDFNQGPGQQPIEQGVALGWFDTLPDGFTNGYFAFRHRLEATLDTREERPAPGHGVRLQGWVEHGLDMQRAEQSQWLRWGGQAAGYVDIGKQRVVQLHGMVDLVDPLGSSDEIPFTEQVWLSQTPLSMGGFLPGQLVGRSAATLTLEYQWPIWVWLEGSVHYSVGNVFGDRFEDFEFERLRQSFGVGFRTIGDRDNSALIGLAFGSEPFVRGAGITSIRFVVGSQSGF